MSGLISAAVKRLRAALGLSSGAGLIGYASGNTYGAGTLGAGLKAEEAARVALAGTVAANATTAANSTGTVADNLASHVASTTTALAGKAALAGDAGQVFAIAAGVMAEHGVRMSQFVGQAFPANVVLKVPCVGLPDGATEMIIQAGSVLAAANQTSALFNYPIIFPNRVVVAFGNKITPQVGAGDGNAAGMFSVDTGTYRVFADDGGGTVAWIAIGY